LHRHRLERGLAEGLDQRGLAEYVAGGDPAGHLGLGDASDQPHPRSSLEPWPQRAVADEGEPAATEGRERIGERHDVLALDQRAPAEEGRALAVPIELAARLVRRTR